MIFVIVFMLTLHLLISSLRSAKFKREMINERFEHELIIIGLKSKIKILERSEKQLKQLLTEK